MNDHVSQGSGSFCSTVDSFVASDSLKLKPQRKEKKGLSGYSTSSSSSEQDLGKDPLITLPSQSEPPKHAPEQQNVENNRFYNSDLIKSLSLEAAKELSDRPKIGAIHSEATLYSKSIRERLEYLSKTETDLSIDEAIEIADAASILKILRRLEDNNIEEAGQMAHSGALLILQADIMAEKGHELLARSKRMLQLASLKSNLNTFSTMESSSD